MDEAALGLKVDATGVQAATKALEDFADQGAKTEKAMAGVEGAAAKTGKSLKTLGDGASKGLDDIGKSAPAAAESVGRVAKSAEDAKRALAGINASVASLGQVTTAATQSARGMDGFATSLQASQKSLMEMQAQVRAATTVVAQMSAALTATVPAAQAAAKAQADAAKSAVDMSAAFKSASDQFRAYSTVAVTASDSGQKAAKSMDATAAAARALSAALAVAGVGFGAQELITMVDGYTKFTAQLKLATKSTSDYGVAMVSVKRIASDAQQGLGEVGTLYARIANGTAELGLSQRKLADITETVSLALKVSGATASESSSAMLQLSQAFASGVLRGEEFNAVNEAAPRLMKALADGIGQPVGALRKMAEEGKLTSAVLSDALPKALGQLREEAKEVQTISGAFTVLKNNIMEMVGAQSNASGTTKALSSGISTLANNLDLLVAAGSAVAVVFGARLAASVTASGVAFAASAVQAARYQLALASMAGVSTTAAAGLLTVGAAARGATAAMGLLGGPVGVVLTAVGLAATAFYTFGDSANALIKSIGGLNQPLEELKRKIDALPPEKRISIIMEIKDDAVRQAKTAEASFVELGNAVVGAFSGMGVVTGATMKEVQSLNDRLRDAQRTGADMTPVLREAARSAGVSQSTLKSWLDLAANIRAAREAAKAGELIPGMVGGGAGRGYINPMTVGEISASARAQATAALDATKALRSQAEQMKEVRKQGDLLRGALKALEDSGQGSGTKAQELRDRLGGVDERLKALAKKGQSGGAGATRIAKADLASDLADIQIQYRLLTTASGNAERLLDAQRAAGLVSEREYYAQKRKFVEDNAALQIRELEDENKRYAQQAATGADKINNEKKIAQNTAKMAEIRAKADTDIKISTLQQEEANRQLEASYKALEQSMAGYLKTSADRYQRELQGMGLGNQWRDQNAAANQINDRYESQRNDLRNNRERLELEKKWNSDLEEQYQRRLEIINDANQKALGLDADYWRRRLEMQQDWTVGANEAITNYLDEVANVAKRTENIVGGALSGFTNGLTDALVDGNLSSLESVGKTIAKQITAGIISEQISAPLAKWLKGQLGESDSLLSSLFGSLMGGKGGGGGGGGLFSFLFNAKGGVYDSPSLSMYSNQVHSTPKVFAFAKGAGVFAEAGPEAIMPLTRNSAGVLGVRAMRDTAGGDGVGNSRRAAAPININIPVAGQVDRRTKDQVAFRASQELRRVQRFS